MAKMSATDSGEQSILCKSSALPSTSAGTCESEQNVSSLLVVESEGVHTITRPPVVETLSTHEGLGNVSDADHAEDFDNEQASGIQSGENVTDSVQSQLVITNVRSVSEVSNPQVPEIGGQSAEDLPPLELNK